MPVIQIRFDRYSSDATIHIACKFCSAVLCYPSARSGREEVQGIYNLSTVGNYNGDHKYLHQLHEMASTLQIGSKAMQSTDDEQKAVSIIQVQVDPLQRRVSAPPQPHCFLVPCCVRTAFL